VFTNGYVEWIGAIAVVASVASTSLHHNEAAQLHPAASPCEADSNYQRLAFWVGDWEVTDSTGAHYAMQRVRSVMDACAITAEWTGRVGDKGLNVSAFDVKTGEWRQVYVSNQVPSTNGVIVRKSDSSYMGPGVRFIPLLEPTGLMRSRVTIMPLSDHRAMQLFEDSPDGGKTWHTVFKAEHRAQRISEP
jgi:hypothetical protein